jgi:hypothetical protein
VRDLAARGILVPAEKKGMYQTLPSIHGALERLRAQASGRGADQELNKIRAQREEINRERDAIELAKTKGEVLTLDEVSEGWSGLVKKVKAMFLGFPGKARSTIPYLTAHDQETLRQIAVDGLNELADEIEMGLVGADADKMRTDEHEGLSRARKGARSRRSAS